MEKATKKLKSWTGMTIIVGDIELLSVTIFVLEFELRSRNRF